MILSAGRHYGDVFLDGVLRPHAFYADTEEGVVREFVLDEKGAYFIRDGEVAKQELRGRVTWEERSR
jgi:hypothetical protein